VGSSFLTTQTCFATPDPELTYKVFAYNGLYGYYDNETNKSGWHTVSWIPNYTLVASGISASNLWAAAYSNTWPSVSTTNSHTVWSDYGILAVPDSTVIDSNKWTSEIWIPGQQNIGCGQGIYNYAPRPGADNVWFGRTAGQQTVFLGFDHDKCSDCEPLCGTTSVGNDVVDVTMGLGAADSGMSSGSGGSLMVRSYSLGDGMADRSKLQFRPSYAAAPVKTDYTNGVLSGVVSTQYLA
jgi:hypothetical protein